MASHRTPADTVLDRYRAAVHELLIALREHELSASHLGRVGDCEGAQSCSAIVDELRKRLHSFDTAEPGYWSKRYRQLDAQYGERDTLNWRAVMADRTPAKRRPRVQAKPAR